MAPRTIEVSEVERLLESLERIAAIVQEGRDDDLPIVRHGLKAHADGIRTAISVVRVDLLKENPWAQVQA